jgi:hypothetical protein
MQKPICPIHKIELPAEGKTCWRCLTRNIRELNAAIPDERTPVNFILVDEIPHIWIGMN